MPMLSHDILTQVSKCDKPQATLLSFCWVNQLLVPTVSDFQRIAQRARKYAALREVARRKTRRAQLCIALSKVRRGKRRLILAES